MLDRLTEAILAVCPINGVSGNSLGPSNAILIDFLNSATVQQRVDAQTVLDNFDWSQATHDTWIITNLRNIAKTFFTSDSTTDHTSLAKVIRAVAFTSLDEINVLRAWITSFKSAVAAASSLNDLKTRVAALSNTPARTITQLKTVITSKINTGTDTD